MHEHTWNYAESKVYISILQNSHHSYLELVDVFSLLYNYIHLVFSVCSLESPETFDCWCIAKSQYILYFQCI